jgi:predicted O-methyltransferase YrrM
MTDGIRWPFPGMREEYESGFYATGATEPWIGQILYSLIVAKQQPVTVLETGGYVGTTSAWLASAVEAVGGQLIVCEIDPDRANKIGRRLAKAGPSDQWKVAIHDALAVINNQPDGSIDFVWVDDDHGKEHVREELEALLPKMAPNGIIAMHDVYGVCDLAGLCRNFGGVALDFPRIGPGGGLGIIQVRQEGEA